MNTISLRLYPETEALYKRLLDECDAGTNGKPATADQFINYLLECAQNPRKVEVSKQADLDRIVALEEQLSEKDAATGQSSARVTELEHKLFAAESELTILREKKEVPALSENQIIIQLSAEQLQMIDFYKKRILQKTGEEPSTHELFIALFNKGHIGKLIN